MAILVSAYAALGQVVEYRIATIGGEGALGLFAEGRPATSLLIRLVAKPAADAQGNFYFIMDDRVIRVRPDGAAATFAGTGTPGFGGDGGPAASAQINGATSVAIDRDGGVLICDTGNFRVRKVDAAGVIRTIAGTGRAPDGQNDGDGGPATNAAVSPSRVGFDANGNLYLLDFGASRVRRIANGVIATQRRWQAGSGPEQMTGPTDMAVDPAGNLYFADFANNRVQRISPEGTFRALVSGTRGFGGDGGPASQAQVFNPFSLTLDSSGNLHFVDANNNRIRTLSNTPAGAVASGQATIATTAGTGSFVLVADGPAASTPMPSPSVIASDPSGNLYVGEGGSGRYRKYRPGGNVETVAGSLRSRVIGDGGLLAATHLSSPGGLAFDAQRNLYIADRSFFRIRRVSPAGEVETIAGSDSTGNGAIGDGGPATRAHFFLPWTLALDPAGNVFVADTADARVRRFTPGGNIATVAGGPGATAIEGPANSVVFGILAALAPDSDGALYLGGTGRLLRLRDGNVTRISAPANGPVIDSGQISQTAVSVPSGMTLDTDRNLYVSDQTNHRILKITPAGQFTTIAGTRQAGFGGDGGPATQARLNSPGAISLDSWGNLYFVDAGNQRIRKIGPGGGIATIAGAGVSGFAGDGGPALSAQFRFVATGSGIAADGAGNLIVSDSTNNRIRKLTAQKLRPEGVLHGATREAGPVAPGMRIVLRGAEIVPPSGEVRAVFDGIATSPISTTNGEAVAVIPAAVAGSVRIELEIQGFRTNALDVPVVAARPGVLNVRNEDGAENSESAPAPVGSSVTVSMTGEGNAGAGEIAAMVGEVSVDIAELTKGEDGVTRLTFKVPEGIEGGVPLRISVGEASSQPDIRIFTAPGAPSN